MMWIQFIFVFLFVFVVLLFSSCVGEMLFEQDILLLAESEWWIINFGIIMIELINMWEINWCFFIVVMLEWMGYDVQFFYVFDYVGMIQVMCYDSVQVGWFLNFFGLQVVCLVGGEVFVKVIYLDGGEGYYLILFVLVDSFIQLLDDILICDGLIDFGFGDFNFISGFLVLFVFIFVLCGIDLAECFGFVCNVSYEVNVLVVVNELVDVVMNNIVNMIVL